MNMEILSVSYRDVDITREKIDKTIQMWRRYGRMTELCSSLSVVIFKVGCQSIVTVVFRTTKTGKTPVRSC